MSDSPASDSGDGLTARPPASMLAAYLEKRDMLLRYFTARTRNPALAEDIVQELYLKIAALDEAYMIDNPTAFLFRTAQNLWLNRMRAETRAMTRDGQWRETHEARLGDEAIVDSPSAEAQLAAQQELALVCAVLEQAPERTRRAFTLHKLEGLSHAETAQRLGVSKSSVEKHVAAAMKLLLANLPRE